jgi:hypothetical protein
LPVRNVAMIPVAGHARHLLCQVKLTATRPPRQPRGRPL